MKPLSEEVKSEIRRLASAMLDIIARARVECEATSEAEADLMMSMVDVELQTAAWGADKLATLRSVNIRKLVAPHALHCLGKSKSGAPKHPLYLASNSELVTL